MTTTLFDARTFEINPLANVDIKRLDDIALLYTASAAGNSSGARFALTVPEAKKWCSSPISNGMLHGTAWAYMWTRISTFLGVFQTDKLDLTGCVDNGDWDDRIASLGLRKINLKDLPPILGNMGVCVII